MNYLIITLEKRKKWLARILFWKFAGRESVILKVLCLYSMSYSKTYFKDDLEFHLNLGVGIW